MKMFNYMFPIKLNSKISIDETIKQLQDGAILSNNINSFFDDVIGDIVNVEKYDENQCWAMVFLKKDIDQWIYLVNKLFIIELTIINNQIKKCTLCKLNESNS
jgi:hypothetical protein